VEVIQEGEEEEEEGKKTPHGNKKEDE